MSDITRVYLVTGAASGIGRATARLLAAPGIALLLHTRANAEGLDATAAEAEAKGAVVAKCLGDLADEAAVTDAVAAAQAVMQKQLASEGFDIQAFRKKLGVRGDSGMYREA